MSDTSWLDTTQPLRDLVHSQQATIERLISENADLLEACKTALNEFDVGCNDEATPSMEYIMVISLLKAAIAKAEGKS